MKRLLAISILLLASLQAFAGAPTVVQHKSVFAGNVTTTTLTFTSAITAGNMIVCNVLGTQLANAPTMTGETFTAWTNAAGAGTMGVWAANSATGGQTVVTLTIAQTSNLHGICFEVHGQAASPRDQSGIVNSSATLSVSTAGATTTANDLVVGFFGNWNDGSTWTAGSGYSSLDSTINGTTGGDSSFAETKTVSATGTQTATATANTFATDLEQQIIIAIAGTASGGTTVPVQGMPPFFMSR